MARIRSIKPSFWTSEQVMECSRNGRLLFIGLWNFCDDAGRHRASCRQLKAEVFPGDDDVTVVTVHDWIEELIGANLIIEYQVDSERYWQVTGWAHQKINKPQAAHYPGPIRDESGNIQGIVTERSPQDRIGSDRKGEEGRGSKGRGTARGTRLPNDWELPSDWESWAREHGNGLDIGLEAAKFRDYWVAKSGAQAAKVDWQATWRNWIRTALERQGHPNGQRQGIQPGEQGSLYTTPIPGVDT